MFLVNQSQMPQTAALNILLDSNAGGDISKRMHPLRTYGAFNKWMEKFFTCKKRKLKLNTYLAKLTTSKLLGPYKVSAS